MNWIFSLRQVMLLLFLISISPVGSCRDLIIITYQEQEQRANLIGRIIHDDFQIPSSLFTLRKVEAPCVPIKEAILHICFDDEGGMHVPVVRQETLIHAFAVFRKKSAEESGVL